MIRKALGWQSPRSSEKAGGGELADTKGPGRYKMGLIREAQTEQDKMMGLIRRGLMVGAAGLLFFVTGFELEVNAQEATAQTTPQAVPQDGPTALSETYQDWVINCQQVRGEDGTATRLCEMSQELRQQDSNQRVLLISIVPAVDAAAPRATIIAPFGLNLSKGVRVLVDENDIAAVPFATCLPAGCVAYLDLESATLDKLRASETAQIVLQPRQSEESLLVTISLAGFTAAWRRLEEL